MDFLAPKYSKKPALCFDWSEFAMTLCANCAPARVTRVWWAVGPGPGWGSIARSTNDIPKILWQIGMLVSTLKP